MMLKYTVLLGLPFAITTIRLSQFIYYLPFLRGKGHPDSGHGLVLDPLSSFHLRRPLAQPKSDRGLFNTRDHPGTLFSPLPLILFSPYTFVSSSFKKILPEVNHFLC